MVNFCAFLTVSCLINTQCLLPLWVNRTEASKTNFKRNHIKILSKVTEFSAFALQFLPFTHFISFCFNLSSSHVNTICKVSSIGREDIGRMGNLRPDLLPLLEVSLLLHWCTLSIISGQPPRKYSSSGGAFYGIMR